MSEVSSVYEATLPVIRYCAPVTLPVCGLLPGRMRYELARSCSASTALIFCRSMTLKSPVALSSLLSTSASCAPTPPCHQPTPSLLLVKSITATVNVGASRAMAAPLASTARASMALVASRRVRFMVLPSA
ncbi:hypothetical protein RLIN73S_04490 [Rhodanobacter lindaniclasticus]